MQEHPSSANKTWSYMVKIINPNGKGGYQLQPLDSHKTFERVQELKDCMLTSCHEYIELEKQLHFGYIIPGHGKKGKQIEIMIDDELQEMYSKYKRGMEILLWMKQIVSRKRSRTPTELESSSSGRKARRSNYDGHLDKVAEVDQISEELSDKHGKKYTPEQYRCWANLIQLQKHDSYEMPPKKRFFEKPKDNVVGVTSGLSPSKRLNMRSECITQLDKWFNLKERGVITAEQYKEVQDSILSDIKKV